MSFTTGQVLTAADLNAVTASDWTAYTPTWTGASSNPSLGNGTLVGRWFQVGKLVHVKMRLICGSTTTYGSGNWSFSLPVASATHADLETIGQCSALGSGAYKHDFVNVLSGASDFRIIGVAAGDFYKSTVPHTWTTGNFLQVALTYEAA